MAEPLTPEQRLRRAVFTLSDHYWDDSDQALRMTSAINEISAVADSLAASPAPEPTPGLREAAERVDEAWDVKTNAYDLTTFVPRTTLDEMYERLRDLRRALAASPAPEPTPGLREALASWVHGDRCTCPYSVEPSDLARADEVLAALDASPEPTGLDADRLRVALKRWLDMATEAGLVGHVPPPEWLAAEYARLGEKP